MTQQALFGARCVYCACSVGSVYTTPLKLAQLKDSQGTVYMMVVLPTCEKHTNVPTIVERKNV